MLGNMLLIGLVAGGLVIGGVYFVGYTNGKNACANANIEYNQRVQNRIASISDSEAKKVSKIERRLNDAVRELEDATKSTDSGCISADQLRVIRSITRQR